MLTICVSVFVIASAALCDKLPELQEVVGQSMMEYFIHWNLAIPVPMLRICMQIQGQDRYKNGLCPPEYFPFLTMKSGQRPMFLGKNTAVNNALFESFEFVGNLSSGDLSFNVNVNGNQRIIVSDYTFLALVKLKSVPGYIIARCHRNLTRYQLILKGNNIDYKAVLTFGHAWREDILKFKKTKKIASYKVPGQVRG